MMKSMIPLQQDAYRLTDLTLPEFFHFRFELFIESTNFNPWREPFWRTILGLSNWKSGPGGRYPAFFINAHRKLFISIYTSSSPVSKYIGLKTDTWSSFIQVLKRLYQESYY